MAGRKPLYDIDTLKKYIDEYFNNNIVFGQVDATEIANYIKNTRKDETIKYYHFTRKPEIKEYIHKINNIFVQDSNENSKEVMISFNSDHFLDNFKSNPKLIKTQLRLFAQRYEELNARVIDYQEKCISLENELNELKTLNKKLKKENKQLKKFNHDISQKNIKLKNFKKFSEYGEMLSYLKQKGLITNLNEDTLGVVLNNCNLSDYDLESKNLLDNEYNNSNSDNELYSYNNIITIKDIPNNSNNPKVNVENAMNLMRNRLQKK